MIYENPIKEKFSAFPMAGTVMQGGQTFISHCHQELELLVVRQGELLVTFEDASRVLKAGDVWLVPPFGSHSVDGGVGIFAELAYGLTALAATVLTGAVRTQCVWPYWRIFALQDGSTRKVNRSRSGRCWKAVSFTAAFGSHR